MKDGKDSAVAPCDGAAPGEKPAPNAAQGGNGGLEQDAPERGGADPAAEFEQMLREIAELSDEETEIEHMPVADYRKGIGL